MLISGRELKKLRLIAFSELTRSGLKSCLCNNISENVFPTATNTERKDFSFIEYPAFRHTRSYAYETASDILLNKLKVRVHLFKFILTLT